MGIVGVIWLLWICVLCPIFPPSSWSCSMSTAHFVMVISSDRRAQLSGAQSGWRSSFIAQLIAPYPKPPPGTPRIQPPPPTPPTFPQPAHH
jgi:hypothetical protein